MTDYRKPLPEGVPELPDGHFYRITPREFGGGFEVQIIRDGWFPNKNVRHRLIVRLPAAPVGMTLTEWRNHLLTEANRGWGWEKKVNNVFLGDYRGQSGA